MSHAVAKQINFYDRPGWIPSHLKTHWDPNPYAYQTEEELMPAGSTHNRLMGYLLEVLRLPLEKQQQMLLLDTFMLYRDANGIKQRVAPDLLLMPWREPGPAAYDLDVEPPPVLVAEITSTKSQLTDLTEKGPFYFGLGVQTYLVIDAITTKNQPRKRIQLHLWRMVNGQMVKVEPDAKGCLTIPELGVSVSVWGQRFRFVDLATGEVLPDMEELTRLRSEEARRADEQARRADEQVQRADEQAQRADEQAQRADEQAQRAEAEAVARQAAEAELAKLKALLAIHGLSTS